ncbi:MAG: AAA family ATPase [Lachnospiraceae bacterium]|nr:AAA family ATPase [Lachnospiraceae bacterium]
MENYRSYREFLDDIRIWGANACGQEKGFDPAKNWDKMIAKAAQSADQGVFSPFLYISLAARLERESMMLLAAAFYAGMQGECLRYPDWELFFAGEGNGFPGAELFFQPPPLLFEAEGTRDTATPGLQIAPRLYLFLCGAILDPQPLPGMRWYSQPGQPLPALGATACRHSRIAHCLQKIPGRKLVYLQGEKGCGRKLNYASLAAQCHMGLAVIPYETLESERHLREIRLECLISRFMFAIELNGEVENLQLLLHWLRDEETVFLLGGQKEIPFDNLMGRQYLPFSISSEDVLMDKELFASLTLAYPWDNETLRKDFLNRYNFLPGRVREILELAASYSQSSGERYITDAHLKRAVLRASSHSLDKYAKKIKGIYQMEDLILPDMPKQKLSHIIHRIRNRKLVYEEWGFKEKSPYGNGVSMVFAGPPGTGKTMAAQVMAAELGMELYRVELPAIVDKYIGETEKKLNRIFSEAEKSMAILFFDEADVLFSKRTEIKESNDKYSNMEIAFLLQKMEEYDGVSILATNYLQNFDSAFRRRISDIIDFPLPDSGLRLKMWQSMHPPRLPLSDEIDYRFLARQFEVSGSVIKNTLIYASFLAAEAGEPLLTMQRILKGLSHELEKSGKKLSRGDYGEYGHLF